jgi:hypothetical protein
VDEKHSLKILICSRAGKAGLPMQGQLAWLCFFTLMLFILYRIAASNVKSSEQIDCMGIALIDYELEW